MIPATRREALMGALAVSALTAVPHARWTKRTLALLVHDPTLEAGLRFAARGKAYGSQVLAIGGDRIRFGRALFERPPALVAGVSRYADALLIEEVAREAGYVRVAAIQGRYDRYEEASCSADWQALGRITNAAGREWIEALADYAVRAGEFAGRSFASAVDRSSDPGLVIGWVLEPRV